MIKTLILITITIVWFVVVVEWDLILIIVRLLFVSWAWTTLEPNALVSEARPEGYTRIYMHEDIYVPGSR